MWMEQCFDTVRAVRCTVMHSVALETARYVVSVLLLRRDAVTG